MWGFFQFGTKYLWNRVKGGTEFVGDMMELICGQAMPFLRIAGRFGIKVLGVPFAEGCCLLSRQYGFARRVHTALPQRQLDK